MLDKELLFKYGPVRGIPYFYRDEGNCFFLIVHECGVFEIVRGGSVNIGQFNGNELIYMGPSLNRTL